MKKLFVILIALALLVGVSMPAFAAAEASKISYGGGVGLGTLRTVTCGNPTGSSTVTYLPTANSTNSTWNSTEPGIIPGKVKILGYDMAIIAPGSSSTGLCALLDAKVWTADSGDVFAEIEATTSVPAAKIFPVGMNLYYGLIVDQSPYTSVTIYYVQDVG